MLPPTGPANRGTGIFAHPRAARIRDALHTSHHDRTHRTHRTRSTRIARELSAQIGRAASLLDVGCSDGTLTRSIHWPMQIHDYPFRIVTRDELQFAACIERLVA